MNFEDWMVCVAYEQGVCVAELDPDDWQQMFEDDCTPKEVVEIMVGAS